MNYSAAKQAFQKVFRFDPKDKPEAGQAWCLFIDTLYREGKITSRQVQNWDNPYYK